MQQSLGDHTVSEAADVQEAVRSVISKIVFPQLSKISIEPSERKQDSNQLDHVSIMGEEEVKAVEYSSGVPNRLEQELAAVRQLLNQRNADLGRIINYIRTFDEEKSSIKAIAKDTEQKQKALRAYTRTIKDSLDASRSVLADLEFERAATKLDGRAAYTMSAVEHALLHDLVRSRLSRNDLVHLALKSKLFSFEWYCRTYDLEFATAEDAVEHYLERGHALGHNPCASFSGAEYLSVHRDVAELGLNPLEHYIRFGVCEPRRVPVQPPLNVKIIMMQKDEVDLIYPWALYHGTMFGFQNLIIIDNGSGDAVISNLRRLEALGTRVIYDYRAQSDFVAKGDIIASIIKAYDSSLPADFYIPLDCDEFIGLEKEEGEFSFSPEDILEELSSYRGSKNALVVRTYLDNHPNAAGMFKKTSGQRKSFFPTGTCASLDRGFNNPKVNDQGGRQNSRLVYVHYHNKPHYLLQEHAKRRLEPFLNDFSTKSLQSYVADKKTGYHSAQHLLTSARDYLGRVDNKRYAPLPGFIAFFESLGIRLPFSDLLFWNSQEL